MSDGPTDNSGDSVFITNPLGKEFIWVHPPSGENGCGNGEKIPSDCPLRKCEYKSTDEDSVCYFIESHKTPEYY